MGRKSGGEDLFLQPSVRVAPLGELKVYMVQEHELESLASGSPASLFLNFALSLLSSAIAFFITLLSTEIKSSRTFDVFVIVCVVFSISGLVLLELWRRNHISTQ